MAEPINLTVNTNVLDSPILEQTSFGPDMKNWLSNAVDIINSEVMTVQDLIDDLNSIFANIISIATFQAGGGGAGPIAVPLLGLTPDGYVIVRLISSTIPVSIINVTAGTNQFTVTFSGNPGASAIISYVAFSQNPQG